MNFLNSLRVSTRLAVGFGMLMLGLLVVSGLSIARLSQLDHELQDLVSNRYHKMSLLKELKDNVQSVARITRNVVLIIDVKDAQVQADRLPPFRKRNGEILEELNRTVENPQVKAQLQNINDVRGPFNARMDEVLKLGITGKAEDATEATRILLKEVTPLQNKYFNAVDDAVKLEQELVDDKSQSVTAMVASTRVTVIAVSSLSIILGLVVGMAVARGILRALGAEPDEVSTAVGRMADGDLTQALQVRSGDNTSIMAAVHRMQDNLGRIVQQVRQGSTGVAAASVQIAEGNGDLSSRTEEQASALEQTAASMEELGSTVRQNADSARQANQLAQNASGVAVQGGEVVAQVVDTMKGINDSSRRIADIITVIDGIAFQTNILALNAAVEAARAGEQGRGFAVVAGEVRSLAGRSAEAAKEIKTLITDSVERVEQGSALVDRAGTTMQEVVDSIRRLTDNMVEINAASAEQSAGVTQVGEAVSQMDQATQQNAALVEETAAAAESLKQQAQELVRAVEVFKVHGGVVTTLSPGVRATNRPSAPARSSAATAVKKPALQAPAAAKPAPRIATSRPAAASTAKESAATAGDDWDTF